MTSLFPIKGNLKKEYDVERDETLSSTYLLLLFTSTFFWRGGWVKVGDYLTVSQEKHYIGDAQEYNCLVLTTEFKIFLMNMILRREERYHLLLTL